MKVLMLNGSPHASGVNDLALREMEAISNELRILCQRECDIDCSIGSFVLYFSF